jgi:hypothetical protein
MEQFYVYVYLDPRKPGNFKYEEYLFDFEPFYIGKGKEDRDEYHLKRKSKKGKHPFLDKIRKIKESDKLPLIKRIIENVDEKESFKLETDIIKIIGRKDLGKGPLLNLKDGGIGGDTFSFLPLKRKKEILEKRSIGNIGKNKGKKLSEETKEKLKLSMLGRKNPGWWKTTKGRKLTKKHIDKIRKGNKGKKLSDLHKFLFTESRKKPVIQFKGTFTKEWESISFASVNIKSSLSPSWIRHCIAEVCRKKKDNFLGFNWKYKN